jgi:hypothetical protein
LVQRKRFDRPGCSSAMHERAAKRRFHRSTVHPLRTTARWPRARTRRLSARRGGLST